MLNELYKSKSYFFLFAHPDDELYSSVLLHRLINKGKEIHIVYATNWDSWWNSDIRKQELKNSMNSIWIQKSNIHLLNISEKDILDSIREIVDQTSKLIKKYNWDCMIWHDYEWGHEWHDIVSFCTSTIVKKNDIAKFFVFPVYHWKPWERKGARFKPERKNYITLIFTQEEKKIKEGILNAHNSQKGHFDWLQKSSNEYMDFLLWRELFFAVKEDINYKQKPTDIVWYEYHRNGFKFDDFMNALNLYYKKD